MKAESGATDKLLEKLRDGDEQAFEALAEQYTGMTDAAVRRFSPSFEAAAESGGTAYEADDLRQVAALALYHAAMTYDPEKGKNVTFGLYAKICVNNALISLLRKVRSEAERRRKAEAGEKKSQSARENDPLEILAASEDAAEVRAKIREELAPLEKQVFDRYVTGMSVGVIAEELGISRKSVSNALYRLKIKIKGLLQNQSRF